MEGREMARVSEMIIEREIKREPSTSRTKMLKEKYLSEKLTICPERAIYFTESWKQTEGEPIILRRAKGLKYVLERITPIVREGELIVGNQTKFVRGAPLFPELSVSWIKDALEKTIKEDETSIDLGKGGGIVKDFVNYRLAFTPEEQQTIQTTLDYWTGKSFSDLVWKLLREETRKIHILEDMIAHLALTPVVFTGIEGRVVLNFPKVLNRGFKGIIEEIENKLSDFREARSHPTIEEMNKVFFWLAAKIVCEGVIAFAERYAQEAERLAKGESKPERKRELEKIAETCRWVPANPARTFYEALQSYWFTFLVGQLESGPIGNSSGRSDQYMYPFYKRDKEEGRITEEEALELLECLRVKHTEIQRALPATWETFTSGNMFCNMVLGGCTKEGEAADNELSLLILESALTMQTNQPTLSIRYNNKLSERFLLKAIELDKTGIGMPAWFNDDVAVPHFLQYNRASLEDARDWAIGGCSDMVIPGKSYGEKGCLGFINMGKYLELALNDGRDPRDGVLIGIKTGNIENITYDEIVEAVKKQLTHGMKFLSSYTNFVIGLYPHTIPLVYHLVLIDDCLEKGETMERGVRYKQGFSHFISGLINVANSLAAIKHCVFENKFLTMKELREALRVNFEGKEEIHRKLLEAPKFGNDIDEVDHIASDLYKFVADESLKITGPLGEPLIPSAYSITTHPLFGKGCGALPDGRKAGVALCDGAVSAFPGTDCSGPTALIRSATKIDALPYKSVQLNMKFHPSALKGLRGSRALLSLIKTFFDLGGYFIQFNVVDSRMLRDAQRHPESYRDLLVRVAGFTAYWVELSKGVQDEIIQRTEFGSII
jgi:formate C-acetyltransferase/4-hydroxyphenylacetate decarboxylase large subunit